MQVIALIGPKSSGKSTLAKAFVEKHPDFIRQRFAEPIKLMLASFLKFQGATESQIEAMLDGDKKESLTIYLDSQTPRLAMQTLGTEWRNLISKTLWSSAWLNKAISLANSGKSIIVDDMRFLHEGDVVRSLGGIVIKIDRRNFLPGSHPSESEYLKIKHDLIVFNTEDRPERMLLQLEQYLERMKL